MWIVLNDSFLSIVAHPTRPKLLLVRARKEEDLHAVFPYATIQATPERDYQFRITASRKTVQRMLAGEVKRINYPNFKDSVADLERHDAYSAIWSTIFRWARGGFKYQPKPLEKAAPERDWLDRQERMRQQAEFEVGNPTKDVLWRTHELPQGAWEDKNP